MRGPNSHARRRHTLLSTLSTVFASLPIRCCHPAHNAATAELRSGRARPCPELLACRVPPKSFSWEKSGEKIACRCAKFGALAPGRVSPRRRRQAKALSCPVARARRDCQKSTLTTSRAGASWCSLRVLQAAALSDRLVVRRKWTRAAAPVLPTPPEL